MKKLVILTLLAGLIIGALPAQAAASATQAPSALARYYPEGTVLFAAMRLNDTTFAAVDMIAQKIAARVPGAVPPGFSMKSLLNDALQDRLGSTGDFDTLVGSWFGGTVAIGIPTTQVDTATARNATGPFIVAADVTDRKAAEAIWGLILRSSEYNISRGTHQTVFTAKDPDQPSVVIRENVLLVAPTPRMITETPQATLIDSPAFADTLAMMPADKYGALIYIDTQRLLQPLMAGRTAGGMSLMSLILSTGLGPLMEVVGPQMWGFTMLGDRALTVDIVQRYGDLSKLEAAGFVMPHPTAAVDPGFATRIPADAPLVVQETELGPQTLAQFQNLRALGPTYRDILRAQLAPMKEVMPLRQYLMLDAVFSLMDIGQVVTLIKVTFAGLTGLNLEKDVLPWMSGDSALFARALKPLDRSVSLTLDAGFVTEVTDPAAAQKVMAGLKDALTQYDAVFHTETIGGAEALVLPNVIASLLPPSVRDKVRDTPEMHLVVGANDAVLAVGTRAAVTFSLDPAGAGLAGDPTYVAAQTTFLKGATSIAYLRPAGLTPLLDILEAEARDKPSVKRDIDQIRTLLSLIESANVTEVVGADGNILRLVLTLAE